MVIKTLIVSLKKEHTETYYVVAEDQMLGPFDKRTITGMRVKKTLLNDSLICDSQGNYTTVIELLGNPLPLGRSSGGRTRLALTIPILRSLCSSRTCVTMLTWS
jgi:hypothetical protein